MAPRCRLVLMGLRALDRGGKRPESARRPGLTWKKNNIENNAPFRSLAASEFDSDLRPGLNYPLSFRETIAIMQKSLRVSLETFKFYSTVKTYKRMRFFVRMRTRSEISRFLLEFPFSFARDLEGAASGRRRGGCVRGGGGKATPLRSFLIILFSFMFFYQE